MSKDYMALVDPDGNPAPIVRQGILVCLTPSVIPYNVVTTAKLATDCLPDLLAGLAQVQVFFLQRCGSVLVWLWSLGPVVLWSRGHLVS